jgi:hypothetical protein
LTYLATPKASLEVGQASFSLAFSLNIALWKQNHDDLRDDFILNRNSLSDRVKTAVLPAGDQLEAL